VVDTELLGVPVMDLGALLLTEGELLLLMDTEEEAQPLLEPVLDRVRLAEAVLLRVMLPVWLTVPEPLRLPD
jgi:hypothetical protein